MKRPSRSSKSSKPSMPQNSYKFTLNGQVIEVPLDMLPQLIYEMRSIVRNETGYLYSPDREAFEAVVAQIRNGTPLDMVCSMEKYPSRRILRSWCRIHPEWGLELEEAERDLAERMFRRVLEIVHELEEKIKDKTLTNTQITGIKLQLDTLKWTCAKLNPHRFADYSKISMDQKTSWKIVYAPELVCRRCGGKLGKDEDFMPQLPPSPESQKPQEMMILKGVNVKNGKS